MTLDKLLKQFRKDWKSWVIDYLWSDECFDFDLRADVARDEMEELFKRAYFEGRKSLGKKLLEKGYVGGGWRRLINQLSNE